MGTHTRSRHVLPPSPLPLGELDAAARLAVLESVHSERLATLRALQEILTAARDLAAVVTEERGYPVLSVSRLDGCGSMFVGCAYHRDEGAWWVVTSDPQGGMWWLAPARQLRAAAMVITDDLRGR